MSKKKAVSHGNLPSIFLSDGYFPHNVIRFIVLTNYDVIVKAFKNPNFSLRITGNSKARLLYKTNARHSGLFQFVNDIGLKTGNTKKAIESNFNYVGMNVNYKINFTGSRQCLKLSIYCPCIFMYSRKPAVIMIKILYF